MTLRNALVGALVAVSLTACGTGASTSDNGKIKVAASTNVWGSVIKAVGGDAVEVTSIINDPSADPHSYESKPVDVAAVREAKLVIFNGGGYDDFFAKLLGPETESAKKIEAYPFSGLADEHKEGEAEHAHAANEHVWYHLPTVHKVADQAAQDLAAIAPDKKATFEANAKEFGTKIDELQKRIEGKGKGKKAAVTEPVPVYLLDVAGVEDGTPPEFSEAIEQETDVPAAALAQMNQLVETKQVAFLVNNKQTENTVTRQVVEKAKTAGVPVVDVTETLPEGVSGYLDWMTKQVDALSTALGA